MKKTSRTHESDKKSMRREDRSGPSRSKSEEKRMQIRREWMIQQERQKEHERLRAKMILEYEIRRARQKGLPLPKGKCSQSTRSKSGSRSPETKLKKSSSSTIKPTVMSEKIDSSSKTSIFKKPERTQIDANELRKIKVDIHRNIPAIGTTIKLERDIINPEDVVVKRRDGEGSKPIFERDELKRATDKFDEVEEHRIVQSIDNEVSARSVNSEKPGTSVSPSRKRSSSPRRTSSRYSRHGDSKYKGESSDYHSPRRSSRERNRSRERSREHRERYSDSMHHSSTRNADDHSRQRRDRHDSRDRSRDRERRNWDRDSHHRRSSKEDRSYREYGDRSRERSRERRERERSRERRPPPPHYIEQVPVPIYYGNFPPRPIVVGPMVPFRGQMPMPRARPFLGPVRPFHPRFAPPDIYRLGGPPNPRFGPIF